MPDAINSTTNATAPPPVPTPKRGDLVPCTYDNAPVLDLVTLVPSKPKLDVNSPASVQQCQFMRSRKEGHISTCKTLYWIRDPVVASDDFI